MELDVRCKCGKILCKRNDDSKWYEFKHGSKKINISWPFGRMQCWNCDTWYLFMPFDSNFTPHIKSIKIILIAKTFLTYNAALKTNTIASSNKTALH